MEAQSILLTGGAGYVGVEVLKKLLEVYPKSKIIVLDNFSKGKIENIGYLIEINPNIVVESIDIRDSEKIEAVFRKYNPHIVIHLAAIVDAFATNRRGKDEECMGVNHEAAVNLANISKKNGCKIFIFQSSVSVYSRGQDMKEDEDKNPLSYYGMAKLLAEKEINSLNCDDFKVCILRPATVIGYNEGFRYETIINLSCIRSIYNIPLTYFESAIKNDKSYLYVKDNVKAIFYSIDNIDRMKGQIYNISSFNTNLERVIFLIEKYLGRKFPYEIVKEKSINQQVYTISAEKIKSIGFEFKGDLDEIIDYTINNLLNQKVYNKFNTHKLNYSNFEFNHPSIKGLVEITPKVFVDDRGHFLESFHMSSFKSEGIPNMLVQENQSLSKKGVLRGLHIQKFPHGQGKLIRVVKGKVLDVAVDVRSNSETYGMWHSVILSDENKKMFYIPEGFLHGFLTLEDDTIFQYKCTNYFNKDSDGGVVWNDPTLNIDWKLDRNNPIISDRDKNYLSFDNFKKKYREIKI